MNSKTKERIAPLEQTLAGKRNVNAGNKFFQDHKPWEALKADKELCGSYLAACMGLVAILAALVEPYMPSITIKVLVFSCLGFLAACMGLD